MCRMLGLLSADPSVARACLESFYPLCQNGKVKSSALPGHLDGWGIAGYPNGSANYYERSSGSAVNDHDVSWPHALDKIQKQPSRILLAHFRKASVGDRAIENTHPFLKNGWLFCHNGTIFDAEKIPLKKYAPAGSTDSERFFLFLLEEIERNKDPRRGIKEAVDYAREKLEYNSLTFLLTDGSSLYAHRRYSDQRMSEERDRYYTLWSADTHETHLICSEPILNEKKLDWTPLSNGALLIL